MKDFLPEAHLVEYNEAEVHLEFALNSLLDAQGLLQTGIREIEARPSVQPAMKSWRSKVIEYLKEVDREKEVT